MNLLAHVDGLPLEEALPLLAAVIALYLFGRRRGRQRRREVTRLPGAAELLDAPTTERVLATWSKGRHGGAAARHVPLFYPPGPDGLTAGELAVRTGEELGTVQRLLAELQELGYVELDGPEDAGQQVTLTIEGYDLLDATEGVLLEVARERSPQASTSASR